jgi:proline iminopeptidase
MNRDGFELEIVREGRGIPMLVVGSTLYYRRALPAALRDDFELVFCSLRHWAPSPEGLDISTITVDTYSDDIEAMREAAGVERPLVLGHSIHGTIALEYARRYPEQVRGVVAVGAPAAGMGALQQQIAAFWEADASPERRAAHEAWHARHRVPEGLEKSQDVVDFYVANGAMYWADPTFDASPGWEGVETNMAMFGQLMGVMYGAYELEPLDVPVFLALGRYDYVVPYTTWDESRHRLSNLRYRLYEQSGHTPPMEEPEAFAADVAAWAREL